jgi:hypothetical protein
MQSNYVCEKWASDYFIPFQNKAAHDIFDNIPAVFTLFLLTYPLTTTSHTTFPLELFLTSTYHRQVASLTSKYEHACAKLSLNRIVFVENFIAISFTFFCLSSFSECLNYQMKMATPQTRRQRGALLSCAMIMLVLGSAIIITGFCFEFHGVYEKITNPTPADIHHIMFPRTQYWLGLPVSVT